MGTGHSGNGNQYAKARAPVGVRIFPPTGGRRVRIVDPVAADQPPAAGSPAPGYWIEVNTGPQTESWGLVCLCENLMEARRVQSVITSAIAAEVGEYRRRAQAAWEAKRK